MHLLILLGRKRKGIVWVSFYQNQFLHLTGMRIALPHLLFRELERFPARKGSVLLKEI